MGGPLDEQQAKVTSYLHFIDLSGLHSLANWSVVSLVTLVVLQIWSTFYLVRYTVILALQYLPTNHNCLIHCCINCKTLWKWLRNNILVILLLCKILTTMVHMREWHKCERWNRIKSTLDCYVLLCSHNYFSSWIYIYKNKIFLANWQE